MFLPVPTRRIASAHADVSKPSLSPRPRSVKHESGADDRNGAFTPALLRPANTDHRISPDGVPSPIVSEAPQPGPSPRAAIAWVLAGIGALFAISPWARPELALLIGIALALLALAPPGNFIRHWSKLLIQVCVVLLGFGMNLGELARAGLTGIGFAFGTIVGTFALGVVLARALQIDQKLATLISSGTAICGGSAIAAVGSTISASGAHMSVSIGAVFILNACLLYTSDAG